MKSVKMPSDLMELMDEHAPLLLRDDDGRLMFFKSFKKMYLELLKQLRRDYSRGYIEVAHYLDRHYNFSIYEVDAQLKYWNRKYQLPAIFMVNWNALEDIDYKQLKMLCQCLHEITETQFSEVNFKEAFEEYKNQKIYG